jgi:hypothetical protein
VSYAGAVLTGNATVRSAFESAVATRLPLARVVAPKFPPIVGAFLLGVAAAGWQGPLDGLDALKVVEW